MVLFRPLVATDRWCRDSSLLRMRDLREGSQRAWRPMEKVLLPLVDWGVHIICFATILFSFLKKLSTVPSALSLDASALHLFVYMCL